MSQELLTRRKESDFFPSHYDFRVDHLLDRAETVTVFEEVKRKEKTEFGFVFIWVSNSHFSTVFRVLAFQHISRDLKTRCALMLADKIEAAKPVIETRVQPEDNVLIIVDSETEHFLPKLETMFRESNPKRFISVLSVLPRS